MRDIFTTVLRYKLWFDLWGARQRTLQAVMTIAIGAFAVGTILGALWGVRADTGRTWSTVAAPTILLRISPPADDALLDSLRNRPELVSVDGQMEAQISWRNTPDEPWQPATLIARDDYESQQLNLLLLEDGDWPRGRITAVERHFGVEIGQRIQLKIGNQKVEVAVGGTIYNRAGLSAVLGGDLVVYTSREHFAKLTGRDGFTTLFAALPTYTPETGLLATTQLQSYLAEQGFSALPAAYDQAPFVDPQEAWFETLISGIGLVMQVVGIITMALSLLLIYTTVTAIITQQTAQIGELKAIGASSRQIVHMYVLLVGAYGVMAALISIPASIAGANFLRHTLVARLGMDPGPLRLDWEPLLIQLLLCVLSPVLIALVPILRGARITVREAISTYGLSSTGNAIDALLARMVWLSRVVSMAISNAFRSWSRLVLTQLALGGAGITLVAVLSTQATLNYTSGELMRSIYPFQVQLNTKQPTSLARLAQGSEAPGVERIEIWQTLSVVLEAANGASRALQVSGLPLPSEAYRPQLAAGRWLTPDDTYAIALVESLAEQLDIQVGDTVRLKIPSPDNSAIWTSEHEWEVVGIVLEPYLRNLSRYGFVPRDTLMGESQLGMQATRVQLEVPAADSPDAPLITNALRTFYDERGITMQTTATDTVYERSAMEASNLNVIAMLLLAIAVIMAAVGGVALSGVLQISVLERRREIGVLRAIGATPRVVRTLFVIEGLILGWLSCLVALCFSYPVGLVLSRMLATTIGISIVYQYAWWGVLLWLILASIIGVFASLSPAQRAINESVQESLAYE